MSTPYPGGPPGPQWPPAGGPPAGPPSQWGPPPEPPPGGPPPQWSPPPGPPGGPHGGGPGWGAPPPGSPPPGSPPPGATPRRRRTGLVLALVGGLVVLALVGAAVAFVAGRSDDGAAATDFGPGPASEPEEEWSVDVDVDDDGEAVVLSDGDQAYVLVETAGDEGDTTVAVTAHAAADGEVLWDAEVASSLSEDPVRLLGGGSVLLFDDDEGRTRLVDAETGDERWETDGVPVDTQLTLGFGPPIDPGDHDLVLLTIEGEDDEDAEVVAVERESGDELWTATGEDALVCGDVVVTIVEGESGDDFVPTEGQITGHDPESGEELWAEEAFPGLCDDDEIALGTGNDQVTLFDVEDGGATTSFDLAEAGDFLVAIPFDDRVTVSSYSFSEGDEEAEGTAHAAIYPREGGDPIWEDDDSFAFPVTSELVLTADEGEDEATFVRSSDGEDVGTVPVDSEDNACEGALTRASVVVCETGDPQVTSYVLDDEARERWTLDVGAGVVQLAVGGDRLFALTEDEELVALR